MTETITMGTTIAGTMIRHEEPPPATHTEIISSIMDIIHSFELKIRLA